MPFPQQSPINLDGSVYAELGDLSLDIRWKKRGTISGELLKGEHGLKVIFFPESRQFVRLGHDRFQLIEFHFHHPSEHWLKGEQQFMELHAVHRKVADGTSFCVASVFIDIADDASEEHEGVLDFIAQAEKYLHSCEEVSPIVKVQPRAFLPKTHESHYRYEGSLTTGEHDETVSWIVMRDPLQLKPQHFVNLIHDFKAPARNPQPLNRRFLVRTFK